MKLTEKKLSFFKHLLCLIVLSNLTILGSNTHFFVLASENQSLNEPRLIQIAATTKEERSAIANFGVSIEDVRADSVWVLGNSDQIEKLRQSGFQILANFQSSIDLAHPESLFGFPAEDSLFHTYDQLTQALKELQTKNSDLSAVQSIGKSTEGRDLWAFHINSSKDELDSGVSQKPGIIFMGNHHAREHLSLEVPFMLAQYLMSHREDPQIKSLLHERDVWVIPMVNPDGAEFDISTGKYKWWRKNRKDNGDGTFGVDLNRNYGYKWGTGGSDSNPGSEVYRGTKPFSEAETQSVRHFIDNHPNLKILLSFHTFSELILYPWGHTYDPVTQGKDRQVYEIMSKTMAKWNHYTPKQSSALYIASGDTTDWAYGEHGIFSFTFELSPSSLWEGGFYPGAKMIDQVFNANLNPCLYLIKMSENPYQVLEIQPKDELPTLVQPKIFSHFSLNLTF